MVRTSALVSTIILYPSSLRPWHRYSTRVFAAHALPWIQHHRVSVRSDVLTCQSWQPGRNSVHPFLPLQSTHARHSVAVANSGVFPCACLPLSWLPVLLCVRGCCEFTSSAGRCCVVASCRLGGAICVFFFAGVLSAFGRTSRPGQKSLTTRLYVW